MSIKSSYEEVENVGTDRVLLVCIILPAVIFFFSLSAVAGPRNIKIGEPVGDFKLSDVDGKPVDTTEWKGSPSVWLFISAGQKSSEQAIRDLEAMLKELGSSEIRAVALSSDGRQIPYFRMLRARHQIHLPIALDLQREVYGRVGVIVLPTTLVVDRQGKLHHVLSGYDLGYKQEVSTHLAFIAGKISQDQLKKDLAGATGPSRNLARERAERLCRSAGIMFKRGLSAEAEEELRQAIEADPDYSESYLGLAELKAVSGQLDAAEALVRKVQQREPDNRQAKPTLGMIRLLQRRLDEAEKLLEEALMLNPDPARTLYWLGRIHEERGQSEKAAVHYRAAAERLLPALSVSG